MYGSFSGVKEDDFLENIGRLNQGKISGCAKSKGEIIDINGPIFEVLWPPKYITNEETLKSVENALEKFYRALEEDNETEELFNSVRSSELVYPYIEGVEIESNNENRIDRPFVPRDNREIPDVVKEANESLAGVANDLSLVLCEDNRFIFWGDIEDSEIRQIVLDLKKKRRTKYYVSIAPHHGTHWNEDLTKMHFKWSIASNGKKMIKYMKPYKKISDCSFSTFVNGGINL